MGYQATFQALQVNWIHRVILQAIRVNWIHNLIVTPHRGRARVGTRQARVHQLAALQVHEVDHHIQAAGHQRPERQLYLRQCPRGEQQAVRRHLE